MADCDFTPYGRVYLITNKVNGKRYIGQTVMTLAQRFSKHLRTVGCSAIHSALKKYGPESFSIEELAVASTLEDLNSLEEKLISQYETISPKGYNLKTGGGSKGRPCAESKRLMSGRQKIIWQDESYRVMQTAKHSTEAYRKKIADAKSKALADPTSKLSLRLLACKTRKAEKITVRKKQKRQLAELSRANRSSAIKARWADPVYKEKMQAAFRKKWENDSYRVLMKNTSQSDEAKEKRRASLRIAISMEGVSEKRSAAMKARWADPVYKEKMLCPDKIKDLVMRSTGKKHTPETRAKLSALRIGKEVSSETRIKISKANQGRLVSQETRSKISIAHTGRALSREHKEKLKNANLGKKTSEQTKEKLRLINARGKPVRCIESGEVFLSSSAAARHFGMINGNMIGLCCRGKATSAYGYHFECAEILK